MKTLLLLSVAVFVLALSSLARAQDDDGGITVTDTAGGVETSTAPVQLGTTQTWITSGGTLTLIGPTTTTNTGGTTSVGSLTKTGTGTLTIAGAATYTGGTTVNSGTLVVAGAIASSLTITDTNPKAPPLPSTDTGSGAVLVATGGISTFSGGTSVSSGTLNLGNTTTGTGAVTVSSGGTLAGVGTISGTSASGTGGILEIGSGSVTFSGTSNLSGLTTINAGVISVTEPLDFSLGTSTGTASGTYTFSNPNTSSTYVEGVIDTVGTSAPYQLVEDSSSGAATLSGIQITNLGLNSSGAPLLYLQSGDLQVVAIPEPSTWALAIGALTALAIYRRRLGSALRR